MKMKMLAPMFGAAMALGLASAASATVAPATSETFDLTVNGCGTYTSCFASGVDSLGTVTITENSGELDFDVSLANGAKLYAGSLLDALAFNISGSDVSHVEIGNLTSGFTGHTSSYDTFAFGTFDDSVSYTGHSGSVPTSFSFTVSDRADNLSLSDLVSNASNVYYPNVRDLSDKESIYLASDLTANHHSGEVGALAGTLSSTSSTPPTPGVPEPAAWAMMLLGISAVGGSLRVRRQGAASPAKA